MKLLLALVFVSLSGCYSSLQIAIQSTAKANAGRPFYVMVRKADDKTYISEDYKVVSNKLFSYPKEKSIVESKVIIPGQFVELSVKKPEELDLAVYFFFTEPGDHWRLPIHQPFPSQVEIILGSNQIKRVRVKKR